MQWSRLGYLCTCARAHRASVSQERLGRLCSNLVCGSGVINYVLSTSHWLGSSARAHVHTPSPYLRSRLTDCAKLLFVARGPIVTKLTTISKENHSLIHSIYYTTTTWQEQNGFSSPECFKLHVQRRQVSRPVTCFGIASVSDDASSNSIRALQNRSCSLLH